MAFIADYVALHDCTQTTKKGQSNSIEPLVRYLKRGHPLTPLVRSWLVNLLEQPATGEFRLEYKRRAGQPRLELAIEIDLSVSQFASDPCYGTEEDTVLQRWFSFDVRR